MFLPLRFLATFLQFPHIVSSLEYSPPLNSFCTLVRKLFKFLLHKRKTNVETTYKNFSRFYNFQKRIVSAATIYGNTVCSLTTISLKTADMKYDNWNVTSENILTYFGMRVETLSKTKEHCTCYKTVSTKYL